MDKPKPTKLPSLILSLYKNNFGLFLRIMLPVAFIAIILNISLYYYQVSRIEQVNTDLQKTNGNRAFQLNQNNAAQQEYTVSVILNTNIGITPIPSFDYLFRDFMPNSGNRTHPTSKKIYIQEYQNVIEQFLPYPINYRKYNGITRTYSSNFTTIVYSPLILLIFTLCPLSLAMAHKLPESQIGDISPMISSPNSALSVWKHTLTKILKVIIVPILFILIVEASQIIYLISLYTFPNSTIIPRKTIYLIILMATIYFCITLSLYNQCLIFQNLSIIEIFKRSHALVKGVRLKFLSIFLITALVASIISSVFMGSSLLLLSYCFPKLAPIRDALPPLKFISLFIGGNASGILPNMLGILPTVLILLAKGIVTVLLVPFWAIVTTLLYNDRIDLKPEAIAA
ncbi:hypothetical protein JT359_02990 [Candidatus Poribacteria bacterium]|nr:hypothetical protein [Candidatus Poribacteria bacterium]